MEGPVHNSHPFGGLFYCLMTHYPINLGPTHLCMQNYFSELKEVITPKFRDINLIPTAPLNFL